MFYLYVLRSEKTGRRYVGSCQDVQERLRRHNAGHSKATRHGAPWSLEHFEPFSTRAEAMSRFIRAGQPAAKIMEAFHRGDIKVTIN